MFTMQRIDERSLVKAEKPELVLLDTPELNAETPAHLLDDDITPTARLFARNTGAMPALGPAEIAGWTLTIDGCVRTPRAWTIAELKREFETVSETAVIECAGNGRAFFPQPAGTVLWRHGAVGCVRWTGVRLGDLLRQCELLPQAVYTGHHSPDVYLDGSGPAISRGLPIDKALAPETLVAFALNGEPLPVLHGGPLRLVAPGYPGASFQKWLTRVDVRDREHDGERMMDGHYRMPRAPLRHGEPFDHAQFEIITDMPVKSLITAPPERIFRHGERAAADSRPRLERAHPGRDGRAVIRRRRIVACGESRARTGPLRLAAIFVHARRAAAAARSRSSRAPPTRTAARNHWKACRGIRAAI